MEVNKTAHNVKIGEKNDNWRELNQTMNSLDGMATGYLLVKQIGTSIIAIAAACI